MKIFEDKDGCRYLVYQYQEKRWRIEDMLLGTYLSTDLDGHNRFINEHGLEEVEG